jgi:sugar lactone lactonase YvrE
MTASTSESPRLKLPGRLGKLGLQQWRRWPLPFFCLVVVCAIILSAGGSAEVADRDHSSPGLIIGAHGTVFASSTTTPLLQFPEGLTAWKGKIYTATYNVANPALSRILVFDAKTGKLVNTLGGKPGQELINQGPLLGLTFNHRTGDLFCAANGAGVILRIQKPWSDHPQISVYATYPKGGGPEDLVFYKDGTLFATDSNLGVAYTIPPGGGQVHLLIGPPGTGAPVSDDGLFASPVAGLSPNGIAFSLDWHTLFIANTWSDSIIAFHVNDDGQIVGHPRIFAQHRNDDLEEYPTGFTALIQKDTKIGPGASTPLNGPDGLDLDSEGHLWVSSNLGDNLTVLDGRTGKVITTYGKSAVTQGGLLNQPSNVTWVGTTAYCSNLGIFTGLAGTPNLPWRIVAFKVGVTGAAGNGQP